MWKLLTILNILLDKYVSSKDIKDWLEQRNRERKNLKNMVIPIQKFKELFFAVNVYADSGFIFGLLLNI